MIYRKQTGFDDFHCIADKCPKSCCEGWQIVIDPESLEKYQRHTGLFRDRLESGIDQRESCFRQKHMRCAMLASSGLCDLQSTLGEAYLCDTCRQYPRHLEDFPDLREYSLSLSCPEAVRMMMESSFRFSWTETEDELFDDPDEFEDFDPILFDRLSYARECMFSLAKDASLPLQKRMDLIASAAYQLQGLYDEGDIFAMDDLLDHFTCERTTQPDDISRIGFPFSYTYMCKSLNLLLKLEVLEEDWMASVRSAKAYWQEHTERSPEWYAAVSPSEELSHIYANLLQSLLFTYVCGSIYDGQIYARTMIAVMSVRWIMMLSAALPELSNAETIYLFSREVEHSDLNVNALISYFEEEL